jgi:hypothetical protein
VAQIKVPRGTFICATNRNLQIQRKKTFTETENGDMCICVFVYSPTKSQPDGMIDMMLPMLSIMMSFKHILYHPSSSLAILVSRDIKT